MCNSENGNIAWCNENSPEWGFLFFLKKKKTVSVKKKTFFFQNKTKKTGGLFFLKTWVFLNLD